MTRTETIDTLYASAWVARRREVYDNVFKKAVLWAWLTADANMRGEGPSLHIEEQLMYQKNTTFKSLGVGGTVSITPTDPITLSKWPWKRVAGSIIRYAAQENRASGARGIGNLVEKNLKNGEQSFIDELNAQAWGDGTGNSGNDIDGLDEIIATAPTTGTVGGIDSSTQTWWRNQYKDMSSLSFATYGIKWMRNMVNSCEDNGIELDLIITSQDLHELYEAEIGQIQQVIPMEKSRNKIADLGFRALYYKEIPVFFDKNIPNTNRMYFINASFMHVVYLTSEWFDLTSWKEIPNQVKDKVAQLVSTLNITCSNRRRQGVMFNLS